MSAAPTSSMKLASSWGLTALAPLIWGTSYIVFTQTLPREHPIWVASARVLPAGAILLALGAGALPKRARLRVLVLSLCNISAMSALLLVSAARLPGGLTATLGALQPAIVTLLAWPLLRRAPSALAIAVAAVGAGAVALLVAPAPAAMDLIGLGAGLGAAAAMALGTVLTQRWRRLAPALPLAAWQLIFGGLVLVPVAAIVEGPPPVPTATNLAGLGLLILPGTTLTYWLWVRGIVHLGPQVAFLGLLSPIVATLCGAWLLQERLDTHHYTGMVLILGSTMIGIHLQGQHRNNPALRGTFQDKYDKPTQASAHH